MVLPMNIAVIRTKRLNSLKSKQRDRLNAIREKQKIKSEQLTSLVSIIIPCYNQGIYLDECIDSIINQTHNNIEIVIINDCSTDNTPDFINKYKGKKIKNNEVVLINNPMNFGLSATRNIGILFAKGEYIVPLDADDKISPTFIYDCLNEIKKQKFDIIRAGTKFFGTMTGGGGPRPYTFDKLKYENFSQCTAMFYKKHWEEIGGYKEDMLDGYEDWEFWINMGKHGHHMGGVSSCHLYYRKKEKSMITETIKKHDWIVYQIRNFHKELYTEKELEPPKGKNLLNCRTTGTKNISDNGTCDIFRWDNNILKIKKNDPCVSVIITCYNYGQFLDQCVDSVLSQTFEDFEIIIVDDNSTDEITKDIVNKQLNKSSKIQVIYNKFNMGPSHSRNMAISRCRGKYILPLDADDYIHNTLLYKFVTALNNNLGQFIYSNYITFGEHNGNVSVPPFSVRELLKSNICVCCSMFRKCDWFLVGGYKNIGYEDWDLWISFTRFGLSGYRIPEYLFYYRTKKESRYIEDKSKHDKLTSTIRKNHESLYESLNDVQYKIKRDLRIRVLSICYNEELLIPYFLKHYEKFCQEIVVLDNHSTDNSVKLLQQHPKTRVFSYDTDGMLDDKTYLIIKNNFWKDDCKYWDWQIVVDMDEFLYHPHILEVLNEFKDNNITVPKISGYNMVMDHFPNNQIGELTEICRKGVPNNRYSKNCIFSPNKITDINYGCGAHECKPVGNVNYSNNAFLKLLHYHYFGLDYFRNRAKMYADRLVKVNYDWGQHEYKKQVVADMKLYDTWAKTKEAEILL